jgi:hypothetical protein
MSLDLNALLAASKDVVDRLGYPFDFRLRTEPMLPDWFSIDGIGQYQNIGGEAAGGDFVELPDKRILYVSSEGEAGVIAADIHGFIQLVVMHPYWKDILHFSGGGNLSEMRRAAMAMESFTIDEEDVDLEEARELVITELALDEPKDAVAALHRAVSTSDVVVRAKSDGTLASGLFNTSTIDRSPFLRDRTG